MKRCTIEYEQFDWHIIRHYTGVLRFVVIHGGYEICWCRTLEQAERIVTVLGGFK